MDEESDLSSSDDERGHIEDTEKDFEEVISALCQIPLILPLLLLNSLQSWTR